MSSFSDFSHTQLASTTSYSSQMSSSETATWSSNGSTIPSGLPPLINFLPQSIDVPNVSSSPHTVSDTIPPDNLNRTLVLCFDGTGDQFDSDNSNIVELFAMLKKDDPSKQLVYYQAGIGTYTTPDIATPFASSISKSLDMAIAWNLDAHIMGGYEFLMQNYRANDKICIFGFSRGAYTARCLAGMIHKVGLLPTCNHQQIPFAYKMYTQADEKGWDQSNAFKKAFAIDVTIEFLGVWDTVNSVGLIPRVLPFASSNTVVKTFRHALALDERRAKFKANHWNLPTPDEAKLSITDREKRARIKAEAKRAHEQSKNNGHSKSPSSAKSPQSAKQLETKHSKDGVYETDVLEVWFAGAHCDIGGGSVGNGTNPCLSRIPLRWMIRECFKTKSGILFHIEGIIGAGLDPACLYPEVLPRPPALPLNTFRPETAFIQEIPKVVPADDDDDDEDEQALLPKALTETEEEADLKDALSPVYDQLSLAWGWWVLEVFPTKLRFQDAKDAKDSLEGEILEWKEALHVNLGRGRHVPRQHKDGVKIHRTVKTRLEAEYANGRKYKPAVTNLKLDCVEWVD